MKADEFVAKLATLTPSILVGKHADAEDYKDELVNLVMNYDISEVDFGDIGFADEVLGDEETYEVGMFEEKFIVIDRETGEVRIENDDDDGTIIYGCAESSERFLDALWVAVRHFSLQLNESLKDSDLETSQLKAKQCSEVAGSEDYYPFYEDLLNCYER